MKSYVLLALTTAIMWLSLLHIVESAQSHYCYSAAYRMATRRVSYKAYCGPTPIKSCIRYRSTTFRELYQVRRCCNGWVGSYCTIRGERTALCIISPETGDPSVPVSGTITFTQQRQGDDTEIDIDLKGINNTASNNRRGFHVNENGALGNKCQDAGGHYNPFNKAHGGPNDVERHVGDLGNIEVDSKGKTDITIMGKLIRLDGETSVIGRSIVVSAEEDPGSIQDNNTPRRAGDRLGCCIIKSGATSVYHMTSMFGITMLLSLLFA